MFDECLVNKSCVPCQGGMPPLEEVKIKELLNVLGNDWTLNDEGHLYKEYLFKDFGGPIAYANRVAEIAEKGAHHPDLRIAWGVCTIEIWTHKINGLIESDFILAAKIEKNK